MDSGGLGDSGGLRWRHEESRSRGVKGNRLGSRGITVRGDRGIG